MRGRAIIVLLTGLLSGCSEMGWPVRRPNIVVIMADDLGYSDLGAYGGEIATPSLDRLAEGGLRFTQYYTAGRCCPTRASLMTGLYPHQAGMGWMNVLDQGRPGYRGELSERTVTLAEVLKTAGYRTYMSGKWQLSHIQHSGEVHASWPSQRGFDRFYGTLGWTDSYFVPRLLLRDDSPVEPTDPDYFLSRAETDRAVEFLSEHSANHSDRPFFLYVSYTSPHAPLQTTSVRTPDYRRIYRSGWDALRAGRYERMIELGVLDRSWLLPKRDPDTRAWAKISPSRRREMTRKMAVYAAQVEDMDNGVAAIVEKLEEMGVFKDTLILFLSDNGASGEGGPWGKHGDLTGATEIPVTYTTYGAAWAGLSNTPFRLYKGGSHEGGIASPLIVHWPGGLEAAGELRDQPAHVIDIMPTMVELAGAEYPLQKGELSIPPMAGTSLVPAFRGKPLTREALYWEHQGSHAVRKGDWKLVASGVEGVWELYNLKLDRTETANLASSEPERVAAMSALWRSWAERSNVLPLDGRSWWQRLHPDEVAASEGSSRP